MQVEGSALRRRSAVSERAGLIPTSSSSGSLKRYGATDSAQQYGRANNSQRANVESASDHVLTPGRKTGSVARRFLDAIRGYVGETGMEIDLNTSWAAQRSTEDVRRMKSWREWGQDVVSGDAMVLPLFIVTFSCALADSVTYKAYQTFATSQTGNTVSLAVAALGTSPKSPLLPGVSLAGFVVSGIIFGQLGGYFGHHRRGWLLLSFTFQLIILAASSLVVAKQGHSHPSHKTATADWVYMLLLAVQGGPQVTMATNAGCREIPTAMMTTPYAAFISDPTILQSGQGIDVRARNRRALYIAVFWAGALVGAAISSLCWMSIVVGGCKVVAVGLVVLARGEVGDQVDADGGVKNGSEESGVYSGFQHIVRDERNVAM